MNHAVSFFAVWTIFQLWALLNFADGKVFGDQQGFKEQFGDLKVSTQVMHIYV